MLSGLLAAAICDSFFADSGGEKSVDIVVEARNALAPFLEFALPKQIKAQSRAQKHADECWRD
jgi:hypothetical protein